MLAKIGENISILCTFILIDYCRKAHKHNFVAQVPTQGESWRNEWGEGRWDADRKKHQSCIRVNDRTARVHADLCRLFRSPGDYSPASARNLRTFRAIHAGPASRVHERPCRDRHSRRQYPQTCGQRSYKESPGRLPRQNYAPSPTHCSLCRYQDYKPPRPVAGTSGQGP